MRRLEMPSEKHFEKIAVMGAGGVGCYFGGMLARAGVPVTFIGRPYFVDAVKRDGLFIDSINFQETIKIDATTDIVAARDAELVLFCVKTLATEASARELAPYVSKNAVVLSLQNGVENVDQIRAATGIAAIPAVVYVGAAMTAPGRLKHGARGDLVIGIPQNESGRFPSDTLEKIAATFAKASVPCKISDDIERDLWSKLALNCAGNAITAIAQVTYGAAERHPMSRELMIETLKEVVAVARANGIPLDENQMVTNGLKFVESVGAVTSSTANDIARKKKTEIDALNGCIARLGKEKGIATPANFALTALLKLIETSF
jgi:2-dehydropantoate 2-reductase